MRVLRSRRVYATEKSRNHLSIRSIRSIVERDGQTIHLQKAASEEVMKCMREHTEIYIEVSGIVALWEHVKTFKNKPV